MGEKGEATQKENPDFKDVENGPLDESNRECRDVFCCLIFILNICGMIYCTIHAYTQGNPDNIYRGIDQDGVICGNSTEGTQDYPLVYFYNPQNIYGRRWCVADCPAWDGTAVPNIDYMSAGAVATSSWGFQIDDQGEVVGGADWTVGGDAIQIGYDSEATLDRICLPSTKVMTVAFADYLQSFTGALSKGEFANLVTDVKNNWQWLLCSIAFAVVVSLVFMFLLRCLVGCVVWGSIFGIIALFAGMGVIFLYNAGVIGGSTAEYLGIPKLNGSPYYKTYGYICFGIAGALFLLLLCCCSRLRLAVAVCKVAGQFVIRVCQVTLVPIFLGIILIGMWAVCLLCMIYLLSATNFVAAKDTAGDWEIFTSVQSYSESSLLRLYYFIFATLWCNALIQAIGIFVVASSCCMWYYNHGANSELQSPVTRSFKMAFRYHFGSLAFGSFILAVVQFLQLCLEAFKKQTEAAGGDNKCFEYIINCLRCCMACVERIVKFINETAYIQIALRGKNFCAAAKDGFEIVWSNGIRYLIVAGVGAIIMFIGRLLIAAGTTAAFYCLISFVPSIKAGIIEPLYLLGIVFIIGFAIATLFISIYGLAIDTLLACFIVDEMNQQGKGGKKALHGPEELYELLPDE